LPERRPAPLITKTGHLHFKGHSMLILAVIAVTAVVSATVGVYADRKYQRIHKTFDEVYNQINFIEAQLHRRIDEIENRDK
jgi:hypothetical protein